MAAPNSHIRVAGVWKRLKGQYVRVAGNWKAVRNSYVRVSGVWKRVYNNRIAVNLVISASTYDYNAYTAAGSPADSVPRDVVVTINSGVYVGSTSTGSAGFTVGGPWPAGSTFLIVNNGYLIGKGGAGGGGGAYSAGGAGGAGGPAVNLDYSIALTSINNTSGYILGVGGGGGGGGSLGYYTGYSEWIGGGGGGGGEAYSSSALGSTPSYYMPVTWPYLIQAPANGAAGNTSGPGAGGQNGRGFQDTGGEDPTIHDIYSGPGGAGGTWGVAGSAGGTASWNGSWMYGSVSLYAGGAGGAGGKAINLNSSSISWLGGNNGTQVQGAVS